MKFAPRLPLWLARPIQYYLACVVVHSQATTGNDIYGLRVRWDGIPLDPPGLIPINETSLDQNAPAVTSNQQDREMNSTHF